MHAMSIDDAYHVERVLAQGRGGVTELVTLDGSGPFVRKKMPLSHARRDVWAALSSCSCPRLPQVVATYELPDAFVAVYGYVPGDTLAACVEAAGRFSLDRALRATREVYEAVEDLHRHGVIHKDLAPGNVVIAADGAHVIDCGIARMRDGAEDRDERALGTWGFAAPEQYGFAQADERSDVYAVGRLLGYMLTGALPGDDDGAYEKLVADDGVVAPAVRAVVEKASAFEPSARYQSVDELARALVGLDGIAAGSRDAEESGAAHSVMDGRAVLDSVPPQTGAADTPVDPGAASGRSALAGKAVVAEDAGQARSSTRLVRRAAVVLAVLLVCAATAFAARRAGLFAAGNESVQSDQSEQTSLASTSAQSDQPNQDTAAPAQGAGLLGSTDGTGSAAFADSSPGLVKEAAEALSVTESCWSVDAQGYVSFCFALKNESDHLTVDLPSVQITGRDAAGSVVFTTTQTMCLIQPGETTYTASLADGGKNVARVDFSVVDPDAWNVREAGDARTTFAIADVSERDDGIGGTAFTGEVLCASLDPDAMGMGSVAVTVVARNEAGSLVYGTTGYADLPAVGESVPFELSGLSDVPPHARIEAYAQAW